LIVLFIPLIRGGKWAWTATWLPPFGLAIPAAFDPDIAIYYFAVSAISILGLLLCMQPFFTMTEG
jgi:hypothetical protein